jgi:hypothetical protein
VDQGTNTLDRPIRIATFNVNGINGRLPVVAGMAETGRAGYRLSSGVEGA